MRQVYQKDDKGEFGPYELLIGALQNNCVWGTEFLKCISEEVFEETGCKDPGNFVIVQKAWML